jgi:hypothetical protein
VRVGRYNELWVQILDGLAEGECVSMSPPREVGAPTFAGRG